jgi:5'-phosphate synthase pdxT subunit
LNNSSSNKKSSTIGVLGLQGDIEENVAAIKQAGQDVKANMDIKMVRYPEDMEKIDGLILPGGESTVQSNLASIQRCIPVISKRVSEGMPVLGTCAGMIMLSKRAYDRTVGDTKQKLIGNLDIVVERNAFGRQNDSFEADVLVDFLGKEPFKGVFIRAPAVTEIGKDVEVVAKLNNRIVAVKQKNIIGTAFHPELSDDSRMHKYLINMIVGFNNKNYS